MLPQNPVIRPRSITTRTSPLAGIARPTVEVASWAYLVVLAMACLLIRIAGDRWWLATLVLLGPRWMLALPLAVLVPAAVLVRGRSPCIIVAATIVLLWPVLGLRIHLRPLLTRPHSAPTLRIITNNGHGYHARRQALLDLVLSSHADVLSVQEWPYGNDPAAQVNPKWNAVTDGELHVESRYPLRQLTHILNLEPACAGNAAEFELETPAGPVHLISLHLLSPHTSIHAALEGDRSGPGEIEANTRIRREQAATLGMDAHFAGEDILVAGDFNMPVDSLTFHRDFGSLADAFDESGNGFGWSYRWHTTAVRIDHILAGHAWRCRRCWVGPFVGSPHRPVLADLDRVVR
jgi:vancomycin resistance protein VanJ